MSNLCESHIVNFSTNIKYIMKCYVSQRWILSLVVITMNTYICITFILVSMHIFIFYRIPIICIYKLKIFQFFSMPMNPISNFFFYYYNLFIYNTL